MLHSLGKSFFIVLYHFSFMIAGFNFSVGNMADEKILYPGKELLKETLPLHSGSRLYKLDGLKSHSWYEVKISYPASIPASFSLRLVKNVQKDLKLNQIRRLLNTEKLIFKTETLETIANQGGLYASVSVEPEGIVAIPNVREREFIVYNIVCEELFLGIPHTAWRIVVLVVLCLVVASIVPRFLPPFLLAKNESAQPMSRYISKDS